MARDRLFATSLLISALFHLSMVTVFSIVILFPAEDIRYYSFEFVEARTKAYDLGDVDLSLPDLGDMLDKGGLSLGGAEPTLPAIELPTLKFAELDLLELSEKGVRLGARYDDLLGRKPRDSWARLGRELRQLTRALSRLSPLDADETATEPEPAGPVARPAAGFEARIEWLSEPKDRKLLLAPPIEALWGIDPSKLEGPITLMFKVNADGRVTLVLPPVEDDAGIVEGAAKTLLKYRFAPLAEEEKHDQRAALVITAARPGP